MMRLFITLHFTVAIPAFAQDQAVQRELMLHQQNSDAFQLQLRQSQERLRVAPGDLQGRQEVEARQFSERQRLENVSDRRLSEFRADTPQELRPYERQSAEHERRAPR